MEWQPPEILLPLLGAPKAKAADLKRRQQVLTYDNDKLPSRIFTGKDVWLNRFHADSATLVVTFTPHVKSPPTAAFAAPFLAKSGLACVAFQALENHWWQTREMETCIEMLEPYLGNFDRIVTYGSSMGAHAALAFSGLLKADAVIAAAPQYSISRHYAPFEKRWPSEARRFPTLFDPAAFISRSAQKTVLFDPSHTADWKQLMLYGDQENMTLLHVPYSRHNPLRELARVGVLSKIIRGLITGDEGTQSEARQVIRRATGQSYNRYVTVLSQRYKRRPKLAIEKIAQSTRHLEKDAPGLLLVAKLHKRMKDFDSVVTCTLMSIGLDMNLRNVRFFDDFMISLGRQNETLDLLLDATQSGEGRVTKVLTAVRAKRNFETQVKAQVKAQAAASPAQTPSRPV